jgi:hypothetical protein
MVSEPARLGNVGQANRLLSALTDLLKSVVRELGWATGAKALHQVRNTARPNGGGAAASAPLRAGRRLEREMEFLTEHVILLRDAELGGWCSPSSAEVVRSASAGDRGGRARLLARPGPGIRQPPAPLSLPGGQLGGV